MFCLLSLALFVVAIILRDPTIFIASGLFAIAAEISYYTRKTIDK